MPKVTIDNRTIDVAEGTTILQAAATLGIAVPTLCHLKGFAPDPMCYVCVVQVEGRREMSPSCATVVVDGMSICTDSQDVLTARRTALELMLSDHTGDCVAPCSLACPAHLDNADFIYQMTRGDDRRALEIIKRKIALPASLGRICPRFCEKACRRKDLDQPVAICALRRFAADRDLESPEPYLPERAAASGKRVAIVGAGPAGLSAAFYLQQFGHAATLIEARDEPGGLFRWALAEWRLPNRVLDGEIEVVRRLGAEIRTGTRLGSDVSLEELRRDFDAVLLATGAEIKGGAASYSEAGHAATGGEVDLAFVSGLGLAAGPRGIKADRATQTTSQPGVFAAGNVVSGPNYGVQAIAAGRRAAVAIDQFVRGLAVTGEARHANVVMRDLGDEEKARFHAGADPAARVELGEEGSDKAQRGLDESEARTEARRCLDCDCGKRRHCALREQSGAAGASLSRFRGDRRPLARDASHAEIVYESGKCIQCGRCLRIAEAAREELGLTLIGRGFTVRTAVPLSGSLEAALRQTGRQCAEACLTGAISLKRALRQGR